MLFAQQTYFTLEKTSFTVDEAITVKFKSAMKSPESDKAWVTVVPAGAADADYADYWYVGNGATTLKCAAPDSAGTYEVRLHLNYPAKDYNVVQRMAITVTNSETSGAKSGKAAPESEESGDAYGYIGDSAEAEDSPASKASPGGPLEFNAIWTRYSNSTANWVVGFSDDSEGKLLQRYSNSIGSWEVFLPDGSEATIKQRYSNGYGAWVYSGPSGDITIQSKYSNSISPWQITDSKGTVLQVGLVYSNNPGKWQAQGPNGTMDIYTRYSNSLTKWVIEDGMTDSDSALRMAAVFACIISTLIP